MLTKGQFFYKDVMDLGFIRSDQEDNVFFNQNGYNYFICTKQLTKTIHLDWDSEDKTVRLIKTDKKGCHIRGTIMVNDMDQLKMYINFLTSKKV